MSIVATGKHIDTSTSAQVKNAIDKVLDNSEEPSRIGSKVALTAGVNFISQKGGCSSVSQCSDYGKVVDEAAKNCAKSTTACAKSSLHTTVDLASKSSWFNYIVSWVK